MLNGFAGKFGPYLSALVEGERTQEFCDKNFIYLCGSDPIYWIFLFCTTFLTLFALLPSSFIVDYRVMR